MRKSILNLTGVTLLSKEQMKTVEGAGTCAYYIPKCTAGGDHGPECNYGQSPIIKKDVSKDTAMAVAVANGGYWCCSSCGSASWY